MRVMALFSTSFFAKYLRVGEDGPGRGHLCHIYTFLVFFFCENIDISCELSPWQTIRMKCQDLFSLKNKEKVLCRLMKCLLGALWVNLGTVLGS